MVDLSMKAAELRADPRWLVWWMGVSVDLGERPSVRRGEQEEEDL